MGFFIGFALVILTIIVAAQWVIIWRLLDRLLVQAKIPSLGPVQIPNFKAPPVEPVDSRRKLFSVKVPD